MKRSDLLAYLEVTVFQDVPETIKNATEADKIFNELCKLYTPNYITSKAEHKIAMKVLTRLSGRILKRDKLTEDQSKALDRYINLLAITIEDYEKRNIKFGK